MYQILAQVQEVLKKQFTGAKQKRKEGKTTSTGFNNLSPYTRLKCLKPHLKARPHQPTPNNEVESIKYVPTKCRSMQMTKILHELNYD